jgi:methylthioribose-1-phosphate isomerase
MSETASKKSINLSQSLTRQAERIHHEDAHSCLAMARNGLSLFSRSECVLTYCHTGALATGGIGTALGVIKHAFLKKRVAEVFACETRPIGQGARLTVWECARLGIPVTLICDNMIAALMQTGKVDRVLIGADRIARNGDTSNKIGSFGLATLARAHRIPFHVVAPTSTFDLSLRSGKDIRIELRDPREITRTTPGLDKVKGVKIWNPAFDVTPARLVTSYVTDLGVIRPPFKW